MFRTARKIAAEIARGLFGPTWVEEEYVAGLVRAGQAEARLKAQLAETGRLRDRFCWDLSACEQVAIGSPEAGARRAKPCRRW